MKERLVPRARPDDTTLGTDKEPIASNESNMCVQESKEVFTDSAEVIGPRDTALYLEAMPLSCSVLTSYDAEAKVAGMAHISISALEESTDITIAGLQAKLEAAGSNVQKSTLRYFTHIGLEDQNADIADSLERRGATVPPPEPFPERARLVVRIDKLSGAVDFKSPE